MHGQDDRFAGSNHRQPAQIEVRTVEIVTMHDLWRLRCQREEPAGSGEAEVFQAAHPRQCSERIANRCEKPAQQPGGTISGLRILQVRVTRHPYACPPSALRVIRDLKYVRIGALLVSNSQPGLMPERPVAAKQVPRNLLRATSDVCRADLQNSHANSASS